MICPVCINGTVFHIVGYSSLIIGYIIFVGLRFGILTCMGAHLRYCILPEPPAQMCLLKIIVAGCR